MATGMDQLDAMIATIGRLPELARTAAPDVAEAVKVELERTIAAGTTPDGKPWERTEDGRQPLQHAASALRVAAVGTTIYVRLTGPEARHHLGRARGGKVRQVIPTTEIPARMGDEVRKVLVKHFGAAVAHG